MANMAGTYVPWVEAMGCRVDMRDDLWLCDLGLLDRQPPNGAFPLRPISDSDVGELMARIIGFFEGSPGAGYELWSVWPTPDLEGFGFEAESVPAMAREPGGEAPPVPPELDLTEVTDEEALREVESLVAEAFGMKPVEPWSVFGRELLGSGIIRVWLGRVDGQAVTSAVAHPGNGVVGVYAVATREDARGHGYGAAATWAATLSRPDLPAVLQASEMGVPVYSKMGYRQIGTVAVWGRDSR